MKKYSVSRLFKVRKNHSVVVGLTMVFVAVLGIAALLAPSLNTSRAQRAVAQSPQDRALEEQCTQRIVPSENFSERIVLLSRPRANAPDDFEGEPHAALSESGAMLLPTSLAAYQFVEVQSPECLQFLRSRAQYYHEEVRSMERAVGRFQVDAASRREYCSVPIPASSSVCEFTEPTDAYVIADLNPAQTPLLLRSPVQALLQLTPANLAVLAHGHLKLFITPTPLTNNAPAVHIYHQTSRFPEEWEKDEHGIQGYVSFVAMLPMAAMPAELAISEESVRSNYPVSNDFYSRLNRTISATTGHYLESAHMQGLQSQGAGTLAGVISNLSQSLTARWRQNPQGTIQSAGWISFFDRRALAVQAIKRTYSSEILGRVAQIGFRLVSYYLATATDLNAITDAAGLWWTLRELQLAMACNAAGSQLESVESRNLVEMQYSLQSCRHQYVYQAVTSLNRMVSASNIHNEIPRELQLDSPEWVRSFVLGSRKERSKNISTALGLLAAQLQRDMVPSAQTFYALRTELEQLREELQRNQVVTWLGIKEMTAEDRVVFLSEVAAFQRFFTTFASWLQPHRSQRISQYVTLRALWRDFAPLLSLRPWNELYEPPAMAELNAANLRRSLESLQMPTVTNSSESLRPLSELLSFTASAFAGNHFASQEACATISQWIVSHPQWVELAHRQQASVPLSEFVDVPSCFTYLAKLINQGRTQRFVMLGEQNNMANQCQQAQSAAPISTEASNYASIVCTLDLLLKPMQTRNLPGLWLAHINQSYWSAAEYAAILDALNDVILNLPPAQQVRTSPWFRMIATLIDQEKHRIRRSLVFPTPSYLKRCLSEDIMSHPISQLLTVGTNISAFMVRSQCQPNFGSSSLEVWLSSQILIAKQAVRRGGVAEEYPRPEENDNLLARINRWVALRRQFEGWLFRAGGPSFMAGPSLLIPREVQLIQRRVDEVTVALATHPLAAQAPLVWVANGLQDVRQNIVPFLQTVSVCNGRVMPCLPETPAALGISAQSNH